MPLQTGVFDADSHVMETAEWLPAFAGSRHQRAAP
jgi:hypothetical protein